MAKLSDTQLVVLAAAAARDDGCAVIPGTMKAAAVTNVGSSLVDRKLMREVIAKPGLPVWYEDEQGRGLSLVITAAGRKAIGVEDDVASSKNGAAKPVVGNSCAEMKEPRGADASNKAVGPSKAFREGTKQALVVTLLSAKTGASLQTLEDATGWLPHTTRAALTGLRKKGFAITRDRQPGKNSIYRIEGSASAATA